MEKQTAIIIISLCLICSVFLIIDVSWQNQEQKYSDKTEYPYLIVNTNPAVPIRINEYPFLKSPIRMDKNIVEILIRR